MPDHRPDCDCGNCDERRADQLTDAEFEAAIAAERALAACPGSRHQEYIDAGAGCPSCS